MERRTAVRTALVAAIVAALSGPVSAHVGSLSGTVTGGSVPSWLTVATGGVVIGASFLFTSLLTDHEAIRIVNGVGLSLPTPETVVRALKRALQVVSVVVLGLVVYTGLFGPMEPTRNFAIMVVWAGWWAGFSMTVYAIGNSWPLVNPWRAIAGFVDDVLERFGDGIEGYEYPERFGAWPSVLGLVGLVWVEVVSPVAEDSALLVGLILVYSVVTLAGALAFGIDTWFRVVDPVSRVFRLYGWMAPIQRTDDGIEFRLPTTALTERRLPDRPGETEFVIALLWVTTYDGLVSTPTWATAITPIVRAGVPGLLVYVLAAVGGLALFLWVYRFASRKSRETADTYVDGTFVEHYFAPSLLPIAAGYHAAHFLGYFLTLTPALAAVIVDPFSGAANPVVLVLPASFGTLQLLFVLLGHVLAIWVAHAVSFELFPGILKPLESQYPYVAVMIFYTIVSMWVVVQPFSPPPFV